MPAKNSKSSGDAKDFALAYYENQYDRIGKLEGLRISITNVVITLSAITFTFGFSDSGELTFINGILLPLIMVLSNVFAIIYIVLTYKTIMVHLKRANILLDQYAGGIHALSRSISMPRGTQKFGIAQVQLLFHVLLIVLSSLPIWMYLSQQGRQLSGW